MVFVAATVLANCAIANGAPLTEADIPANLPEDLKQLIEQTLSDEVTFNPDREMRAIAAEKIGALRERAVPAIPFLIQLLDSSAGQEAVDALVAIGEPAVEPCIKAATVEPKLRRYQAIECLGKLKTKRATTALLALVKTKDRRTREWAILAFEGSTDSRVTPALIDILLGGLYDEERLVANHFAAVRDARCVEPLLERLEIGLGPRGLYNPNKICAIVEALGFQRHSRAVPALLKLLEDSTKDESYRSSAAHALGQIGDPTVYPLLVKLVNDRTESEYVRAGAVRGIGAFRFDRSKADDASPPNPRDDEQRLQLLGTMLQTRNEPLKLRIAAAEALGDSGHSQALEILIPFVNSEANKPLQFYAALGVVNFTDGDVRDPGVVDAIHRYRPDLEGEEVLVKKDALAKIAERGDPWAYFNYRSCLPALVCIGLATAYVAFLLYSIIRVARQRDGTETGQTRPGG